MFTSFTALNIVQFLTALNDNIYKLLLIFLLINLEGPEHSNAILAFAGAIFVIPFLLFASIAGTLADRYSKRAIITLTRLTEIVVVSLGVVSFVYKSVVGGYGVLFLMATQSAIFSPCKYGILPEIVKKEKLSHYNGLMTATTYLAIIIGTFLASFLADITHKNFVTCAYVCVVIAILGSIVSWKIEKTLPQAKDKKISMHFIGEICATLKRARRIRYLLVVIVFGAYFLFLGSYVQLNIIPYAIQSLHRTEIQGGYLFLMTAIGIGIGSFLAGRISGKEIEIGFVPLSAIGLFIVLLGLFFFATNFYVVMPLLTLLGILGGFYIVPIDAFIQEASPSQDRGQNVAAANFLNFCGVILAAGLIGLMGSLMHLSAAFGFFVMALITFCIALLLIILMADQVLRLFVARTATLFWNLKVQGRKNIHFKKPALLVAPRRSWVDTIVVMATLPRLIRYVVPIRGKFLQSRKFLYRLLALIPFDHKRLSSLDTLALHTIKKELSIGHSVCLMIPYCGQTPLPEWKAQIEELLKENPIVPIHIVRPENPENASYLKQILSLFKHPIRISYGTSSFGNEM